MANELNLPQRTGLTITAKVYSGAGAQQGSTVNMSEVATGLYSGTFSVAALADGEYSVLFFNVALTAGNGALYVRNGVQISQQEFAMWYDTIIGANS